MLSIHPLSPTTPSEPRPPLSMSSDPPPLRHRQHRLSLFCLPKSSETSSAAIKVVWTSSVAVNVVWTSSAVLPTMSSELVLLLWRQLVYSLPSQRFCEHSPAFTRSFEPIQPPWRPQKHLLPPKSFEPARVSVLAFPLSTSSKPSP